MCWALYGCAETTESDVSAHTGSLYTFAFYPKFLLPPEAVPVSLHIGLPFRNSHYHSDFSASSEGLKR